MKRFEISQLGEKLGAETLQAAAEEIRRLERGPAWFRIWQQLETERKNYEQVLYKTPRNMEAVDYAEAAGALRTIDKVYRILDTIIEEGKESRG